jgi:hypothetical protein
MPMFRKTSFALLALCLALLAAPLHAYAQAEGEAKAEADSLGLPAFVEQKFPAEVKGTDGCGMKHCLTSVLCGRACPHFSGNVSNEAKKRIYQSACIELGHIGYKPGTPAACLKYIEVPSDIACPTVY